MGKSTDYTARQPDEFGVVRYTEEENETWAILLNRQMTAIDGRACDAFMDGLERLRFPADRIPQLDDVSRVLSDSTGWSVARVPALIPFSEFFQLLANRQFPAATFIRRRSELDYLKEPDIFHELFGHTPLLTNQHFADFTETYGHLGLAASKEARVFLARLYWFTVESGLVDTPHGPRIYLGGILSSIGETEHALSDAPRRQTFDVMDALRTPYRIDIMQPLYYVIDSLSRLSELTRMDLMARIRDAQGMRLFDPLFPPKAATV